MQARLGHATTTWRANASPSGSCNYNLEGQCKPVWVMQLQLGGPMQARLGHATITWRANASPSGSCNYKAG